MRERNKLWNRILVERYGINFCCDLKEVVKRNLSSATVKSAVKVGSSAQVGGIRIPIGHNQFKWRVGNETTIRFWKDMRHSQGVLYIETLILKKVS